MEARLRVLVAGGVFLPLRLLAPQALVADREVGAQLALGELRRGRDQRNHRRVDRAQGPPPPGAGEPRNPANLREGNLTTARETKGPPPSAATAKLMSPPKKAAAPP